MKERASHVSHNYFRSNRHFVAYPVIRSKTESLGWVDIFQILSTIPITKKKKEGNYPDRLIYFMMMISMETLLVWWVLYRQTVASLHADGIGFLCSSIALKQPLGWRWETNFTSILRSRGTSETKCRILLRILTPLSGKVEKSAAFSWHALVKWDGQDDSHSQA